jgi:hypothetical protein
MRLLDNYTGALSSFMTLDEFREKKLGNLENPMTEWELGVINVS